MLSEGTGRRVGELWRMRNGYAMCTGPGLKSIAAYLASLDDDEMDVLRGRLSIGLQWGAEVTDGHVSPPAFVCQAFCAALPVSYSGVQSPHWRAFATLVLEAAYEATMLAAALNAERGGSNIVLLTLVGGGAFGNAFEWIATAMSRAFVVAARLDLDVRIVSYGTPAPELERLVRSVGDRHA